MICGRSRRYALDVRYVDLYGGRFSQHLHGENQPIEVLFPEQYAFYPCNGAILDSDPITGLQEGMRLNAQSAFNNSPYPFDF